MLYYDVGGFMDVTKYREWLHAAIIVGEFTPAQKAEMEKNRVQRAKDSIGKGETPASALAELMKVREERMARAQELTK